MGLVVATMIGVALVLNILAVTLPFLTIDQVLKSPETYSLPRSVVLMWERELYIVAILIAGFSIIFPFFKIASMVVIWFGPLGKGTRRTWLAWIERLGKWSMMDIFVVALLLALTTDQWAISTTPHIGVYCFVAAIMVAMATSVTMTHLLGDHVCRGGSDEVIWPLRQLRLRGIVVPLLLGIGFIAMIAAIELPFLRISSFYLRSESYSLFSTFKTLFSQGLWTIAISVLIFLIAMPLLRMGAVLLVWCLPLSRSRHESLVRIIRDLGIWSMLDVFGLSLLLIMTEGGTLIRTQAQEGLYLVIAAIVLCWLVTGLAAWLTSRDIPESDLPVAKKA
jgi:paraquat-inducible protein A